MRLDLAMRMASLMATVILSPISIDRGLPSRPWVDWIEPHTAKAGALVTAVGVSLDRSHVLDLILSNLEETALTHIVEQSDVSIRFRVPQNLAAGRYTIVLALANRWGSETLDQ